MPAKPFLTYDEQIALLESRGLKVNDHGFAEQILKHHNYYRLSAYRFPFQDRDDHFKSEVQFEDLWKLYQFDRGLRLLVSEACKSLEISIRARWAYVLAQKHGGLAYEIPSVFKNSHRHKSHLDSLDRELHRSHEAFVKHYSASYNMARPPIWAACEVMSFGLLSRFFENIRQASSKKLIAQTYGLSVGGLASLLKHTSYLRNLCAHHSRLWNRAFTITVSLPQKRPLNLLSSLNPSADRQIYNSLVLLIHIQKIVNPTSDWKQRLKKHLEQLPRPNHSEMGFPEEWKELPYWQ